MTRITREAMTRLTREAMTRITRETMTTEADTETTGGLETGMRRMTDTNTYIPAL